MNRKFYIYLEKSEECNYIPHSELSELLSKYLKSKNANKIFDYINFEKEIYISKNKSFKLKEKERKILNKLFKKV